LPLRLLLLLITQNITVVKFVLFGPSYNFVGLKRVALMSFTPLKLALSVMLLSIIVNLTSVAFGNLELLKACNRFHKNVHR
jgi:hypothetical protein